MVGGVDLAEEEEGLEGGNVAVVGGREYVVDLMQGMGGLEWLEERVGEREE